MILAESFMEELRTLLIYGSTTAFFVMLSVIVHEAGHLTQIRKKFPSASLKWNEGDIEVGEDYMWRAMTRKEKNDVLLNGFVVGFIPLIALAIVLPNLYYVLASYGCYLYGSWNDIKLLCMKEW